MDVKIGDFGLAHRLIPGKPVFLRYGHPEFIAPEIANEKEATLASDMWSVGVVTYLLLSGVSPFLGENDRETLTKLKEGKIDMELEVFGKISAEARDFLAKLLVFDPSNRIDVKKALNHPWLQSDSSSTKLEKLPSLDGLRRYHSKWTSWVSWETKFKVCLSTTSSQHKTSSCKKWYRRNPIETAFTDPSKMIYPPDREYSPPDTPTLDHRDKFKPSEFDVAIPPKPVPEAVDIRSESQ